MSFAGYSSYNSPGSRKSLNMNEVPREKASEFPRNFYAKEPFNISKCQPDRYYCSDYPIDKKIDYMFMKDRIQHPPWFSRFGYPYFANGYGVGNHPGRYVTPPQMQWMSAQPEGMAPEEFYHGFHADPNYCSSPAYKGSFIARNYTT
jgi:hypothetical protein